MDAREEVLKLRPDAVCVQRDTNDWQVFDRRSTKAKMVGCGPTEEIAWSSARAELLSTQNSYSDVWNRAETAEQQLADANKRMAEMTVAIHRLTRYTNLEGMSRQVAADAQHAHDYALAKAPLNK